jgi:histone deacetylase 1/2
MGESMVLDPVQIEAPGSSMPPPAADHPVPTGPMTQLHRGIHCPRIFTDDTVRWGMSAKGPEEEPVSVDAALGNQRWCDAMDAVYQALLKNQTWPLVPRSMGKNIIGCKWVYKVKSK